MTDAQKHAARLREMACNAQALTAQWVEYARDAECLLAGAEALEAQGEWRIMGGFDNKRYFVPVDKVSEWDSWFASREVGEYTAIVPEWAVPVPYNVVITGWERP